jgi:hypothetical protein
MALELVPISRSESSPVATKGRGRPRTYNGPTLPVSFRVPAEWRVQGSAKARGRVNLTKLFAIYYREFLNNTIESTLEYIARWEEANGLIAGMEDDP